MIVLLSSRPNDKGKTQKNKKLASVWYHLHLPTDLRDADFENMSMPLGRGGWSS